MQAQQHQGKPSTTWSKSDVRQLKGAEYLLRFFALVMGNTLLDSAEAESAADIIGGLCHRYGAKHLNDDGTVKEPEHKQARTPPEAK